jgi:hypothetical protein
MVSSLRPQGRLHHRLRADRLGGVCWGSGDVIANAMTFDIDLDRSVTRAEFAAGFKRLAGRSIRRAS